MYDSNSLAVFKILIMAQGCSDRPLNGKNCGKSSGSIRVNGIEKSHGKRGLNVVVYNLITGSFEGAMNFDTHGNKDAARLFTTFINGIEMNRLILVASADSYTRAMDAEAYAALVCILFSLCTFYCSLFTAVELQ